MVVVKYPGPQYGRVFGLRYRCCRDRISGSPHTRTERWLASDEQMNC